MSIAGSMLLEILAAALLAAVGGELFLKGIVGAAASMKVPKLLIATTFAAFATSSPELTVSTVAALAGKPEIGLGDALGSNVLNIALILGLALMFGPMQVERSDLGRDFAFALTVPLLTLWLARDGNITRPEGAVLLLILAFWIGLLIRAGRSAFQQGIHVEAQLWRPLLYAMTGLLALVIAGRLFVNGASAIAEVFGIDTYLVGALVVAAGTSLPELVTVLLSRIRGHDDVGIGTLLGSNLFNGLAIVGLAASIHPITARPMEVGTTIGIGVLSLMLLIPGPDSKIGPGRGVMLLATYAIFVAMSIGSG